MSMTFKLVAYTDAAGKYNPDAYLNGNEDNFYTDADLSGKEQKVPFGQVANLPHEGMIMVVADGMGGQNAGEVASAIAVDTVRDYFSEGKITIQMAATHESRRAYMEKVIVEADKRIKLHAKTHADERGMGSTMIMAWIANGELSLTWIGDSRAYIYNNEAGLQLVSKDHSYVQSLVDKGVLTYEQTFDHPQGNIILRSLGDTISEAVPESRLYTLSDGDIVMLCSDGLSGVLRDRKTYEDGQLLHGETLEDIISSNTDDILKCKDELFAAAERADWYDNVTIVLCQICTGGKSKAQIANNILVSGEQLTGRTNSSNDNAKFALSGEDKKQKKSVNKSLHIHISGKSVVGILFSIVVLVAAIVVALFMFMRKSETLKPVVQPMKVKTDTIVVVKKDSVKAQNKKPSTEKVPNIEKKVQKMDKVKNGNSDGKTSSKVVVGQSGKTNGSSATNDNELTPIP